MVPTDVGVQCCGTNDVGDGLQDGRNMLRQLVAKVSHKDGIDVAWDDVSNEDLKPELVKAARQMEL